jgi:hypothetical protein
LAQPGFGSVCANFFDLFFKIFLKLKVFFFVANSINKKRAASFKSWFFVLQTFFEIIILPN